MRDNNLQGQTLGDTEMGLRETTEQNYASSKRWGKKNLNFVWSKVSVIFLRFLLLSSQIWLSVLTKERAIKWWLVGFWLMGEREVSPSYKLNNHAETNTFSLSNNTIFIMFRWMFKLSEWKRLSTYDVDLNTGSSASHILCPLFC